MEFVRKWKVGDQEFDSKAEARRYEAEAKRYEAETHLSALGSANDMITNADEVIDLLKPFATPKTRKRKGNGTKAETAAPQPHAPRSKRAEARVAE